MNDNQLELTSADLVQAAQTLFGEDWMEALIDGTAFDAERLRAFTEGRAELTQTEKNHLSLFLHQNNLMNLLLDAITNISEYMMQEEEGAEEKEETEEQEFRKIQASGVVQGMLFAFQGIAGDLSALDQLGEADNPLEAIEDIEQAQYEESLAGPQPN